MEIPEGYSYIVNGDEYIIEHKRTGMGSLNLFLSVWLTGWTFGCAALIYEYFSSKQIEDGSPITLFSIIAFVASWLIVAWLLLYSIFARKTFRLTTHFLEIETVVLSVRWSLKVPRESISSIKQIKDGGEGEDSFPSWGLQIKSAVISNSLLQRLILINSTGRKIRCWKILSRLPYKHSEFLANVLGQWSGIHPEYCSQ